MNWLDAGLCTLDALCTWGEFIYTNRNSSHLLKVKGHTHGEASWRSNSISGK